MFRITGEKAASFKIVPSVSKNPIEQSLVFSTITVNDSTNKPANHTRTVKKLDAEKLAGEWNTVEVISYNGKCIHVVNGVVVNTGKKGSVTKGRLLLQSEYSEIYYRNARIKQL